MPAVATKKDTAKDVRTVRVVALTHAFWDMHRYRRGDEVDIQLADGQRMPAWCIAADEAPRDRNGQINVSDLPLFFPANSRS